MHVRAWLDGSAGLTNHCPEFHDGLAWGDLFQRHFMASRYGLRDPKFPLEPRAPEKGSSTRCPEARAVRVIATLSPGAKRIRTLLIAFAASAVVFRPSQKDLAKTPLN